MITLASRVDLNQTDIDRANQVLDKHMLLLAESTVAYAKRESPYDTGHNRSSVTCDFYKDGELIKTWKGKYSSDPSTFSMGRGYGFRVYTQSGYGGYLELGTKRMAKRPYIYTGFQTSVDKVLSKMQRCL